MTDGGSRDAFVEAYVDETAWQDGRDPETCRENAEKYATSLFGDTVDRMGWFDYLDSEHGKSPDDADPRHVKRFMRYLQKQGLSPSTRTQARSGVSQWYQLQAPDVSNPVDGLDASWSVTSDKQAATGERRSHPTRDEVEALIDHAPDPTLLSELIIKLLYQTGCRRTEAATIQVDNVDGEDREIRVYGDKTDEWRTVAFQPSLDTQLNIWLDTQRRFTPGHSDDNPYLFPAMAKGSQSDHVSSQYVYETVTDAAENAGLQGSYGRDAKGRNQRTVTTHSLRHAFAVHSAENGVPAPHLQEVLGHHSLDVTQIYADIAGKDAADMLKDRGPSV
jgi:integrase/recombinase XerD